MAVINLLTFYFIYQPVYVVFYSYIFDLKIIIYYPTSSHIHPPNQWLLNKNARTAGSSYYVSLTQLPEYFAVFSFSCKRRVSKVMERQLLPLALKIMFRKAFW